VDEDLPRRQAGFNSRRLRRSDPIGSRPDRLAFWAVVMAVVVMIAAAASAHAATISPGAASVAGEPAASSAPGLDEALRLRPLSATAR